MQNCGMPPPPFESWAEALSTQMVSENLCFWPAPKKIQLSLSEDLFSFFFGLHLILEEKSD